MLQDVKDDPIPPIDAIHWSISHSVVRTAWTKEGRVNLVLKEKPRFRVDVPVTFYAQKRNIFVRFFGNIILSYNLIIPLN